MPSSSVDIGQGFCYFAALGSGAVAFGAISYFCFTATAMCAGWRNGRQAGERPLVQIFVRDNNVDQALKALKKKMQREGSFREMKRHVHYEKPSEKRARQKAEAVRRARKLARKRAQREGLIAAPKRPAR